MNANMYQDSHRQMEVVGEESEGRLPGPVFAAKGNPQEVMSDLQRMLEDERQQHEQSYINEYGRNSSFVGGA